MSQRIGIFLLLTTSLLFVIPFACTRPVSSGPSTGPAPTVTPTCVPGNFQPTPVASGIYWGRAFVNSVVAGGFPGATAQMNLTVNGMAVSTAGITITGTGLSASPLTYVGPATINGGIYAFYRFDNPTTLTDGGTYTLTTVTSIGTASASLTLPSLPNIAADGSGATWSGSAVFNSAWVTDPLTGNFTYLSNSCWSLSSPFTYPSSAYPASGAYNTFVERDNYTSSITGGTGIYDVGCWAEINVTK